MNYNNFPPISFAKHPVAMKCVATIIWRKSPGEPFTDNRYSRAHQWLFDGGAHLSASSSPDIVPLPMSDASLVDPEEAFLASISSCHMLFFLSFCAREHYIVARYEDHAEGVWDKGDDRKKQMLLVRLQPRVQFEADRQPLPADVLRLHKAAHESCFIANSIKAKIEINL